MSLSERLYSSAKDIWESYYTHPFVKGIENGDLPIEKFQYYMVQDYLYLYDYLKVFAAGVVKAQDEDAMRVFAKSIYGVLNGETNIHRSYMKRLNISEDYIKNAKKSLVNTSYTNYMMSEALNGDALDTAVALLSCSWSYKMIADEIVRNSPKSVEHEFYGEWVTGYSSDSYAEDNKILLGLVDRLGENCSEEKFAKLEEIFINCSRYEYEFWNMAYKLQK